MKKNDVFLIIAILLFSAVIFAFVAKKEKPAEMVQIYKDNKLFCEIPIDEAEEIDIDGKNCVVVEDNSVYMESADCPDQICVKQKPLRKNGRDIICLPNGVLVRVRGKTAADAVAG